MSFVSINFEAIPKHFYGLVNGDIVASQLVFVEFIVELVRVELLPVNQPKYSRRSSDL